MTYKKYLYFLLGCVLLLQFVSIPVAGTHLKPYMIASILLFFPLIFNRKFKIVKFQVFETAWIVTYIVSSLSIVYAPNTQLAAQLVLGQCVLLLFFIFFRFLLIKNAARDEILYKCFSIFIYLGLAFYVIGCIQVLVLGNSTVFYSQLNEHSYRVWGCYFERDTFPRLMGVSESPNNFEYFAITILWWSIWKKNKTLAVVSFLTILLTLSTTAMVVLSVQVLLYFLYKRRINWKVLVLVAILGYIGYNLTADNEYIQGMIEIRKVRNETGSGRYDLWDATIKCIKERPVIGYGLNQFREILPSSERASSHNNILETLLSTGAVGLLFYLFFLLSFFAYSIRLSHRYKDPFFLLMSVAFILFGMANNTLTIEYVPFILALTRSYGFSSLVGKMSTASRQKLLLSET